jgi:hypothetical protein
MVSVLESEGGFKEGSILTLANMPACRKLVDRLYYISTPPEQVNADSLTFVG